jgi:hypothetical protein
MSARLPITPETKVAELLAAYPELESTLIEVSPVFARLKNPVLRRTIARVTSLARAAEVAGLPARDLVVRLREAAGLAATADDLPVEAACACGGESSAWADPGRVRWTVDADAMLATGTHPVGEVLVRAGELQGDELGLLRSSFKPAPLIEKLESAGYRVATVAGDGGFATFIGRRAG